MCKCSEVSKLFCTFQNKYFETELTAKCWSKTWVPGESLDMYPETSLAINKS